MRYKLAVPAVALAVLCACGGQQPQTKTGGPPPAVPVSVAKATEQAAPVEVRAIGTVEPSSIVQIRSQVAGPLLSVHFTEGANVNKGDLLFRIDPRPFEDALRQAEAALQKDLAAAQQAEANLARDRAQEKNAQAEAARYAELSKAGVISRSQADEVVTTAAALAESVRASQAAIESARASIQSDRAAIDRAKLELSYCEIRSPIAGRAGNLLINSGNLVTANSANPMVIIHQIAPIYVSFGVPESELAAIRARSANRKLPVEASLQNGAGSKPAEGVLTVIDNTVDAATGTIRLKATFENRERLLWPGQFVNVSLTIEVRRNAVVVPSEAVQPSQKGQMIFVVKADQTVEPRMVTTGPPMGKGVIIEKGIAAGETVVTDGQLRLYPGAKIEAVAASKLDSQEL